MASEEYGERLSRLEVRMQTVEQGVANFRGFQAKASTFFDKHEAETETESRLIAERHKENQEKLDRNNFRIVLVGCVVGIFSLICAACMLYLTYKAAAHSKNDPSELFKMQSEIPTLTAER